MHYRSSTLSLRQRLENGTIAGYTDGKAVTLAQFLAKVREMEPDTAETMSLALDKYILVSPHLKETTPSKARTEFIEALANAAEVYDGSCHHVLAKEVLSRIDTELSAIHASSTGRGSSVA